MFLLPQLEKGTTPMSLELGLLPFLKSFPTTELFPFSWHICILLSIETFNRENIGGWEIVDFSSSCFWLWVRDMSLESESMFSCTLNHTNWPWCRESAYFIRCTLVIREVPKPGFRTKCTMRYPNTFLELFLLIWHVEN